MARSTRNKNLETRTGRLKLEIRRRHYAAIGDGQSMVYRRTAEGFGIWCCDTTDRDGKRTLKKLGMADDTLDANGDTVLTWTQAQAKCRELVRELLAPPKKELLTVAEAAAHYMKWFTENRKAVKETQTVIDAHILPALGGHIVSELTTLELKNWLQKLASQPARKRGKAGAVAHREKAKTHDEKRSRKSTANRILTVLKAILNRAFQDDLVDDDSIWRKVKPFENADEPIIRFLTEAESIRLVNACAPDFRLLVKAALFTGARYGELVRLRVKDVNLDTGMVFITPESKSGKGRHVPLSKEGQDFFASSIAGRLARNTVFLKADGSEWGKNHQVRPLEAACKQAAIDPPLSFHELRHTYASILAQAGADLLTISKLLGHADTRITARHYAHLCDKTLARTVRDLLPGFGHEPDDTVTIFPAKARG